MPNVPGFRRALSAALVLLAAAAVAPPARADEAGAAAAQALFDQAKALMAQHRYAEACPKLEQSQSLDPGGGTLLVLAMCREGEGRTATAWALFNEALGVAHRDGRADREAAARTHIAALGPKLIHLTVVVPDHARVAGLKVVRDGEEVPSGAWGAPLPVDPGSHTIVASAPGYRSSEQTVVTSTPGATATVTVADLEPGPSSGAAPQPTPASTAAPPTPSAAPSPPSSAGRTLGYVSLGVGVAGLGVGSVFGLMANAHRDDHPNDVAFTDATVSTVAFAVGVAGIGAGLLLVLTAPRAPSAQSARLEVTPMVGAGVGGVRVRGAW